MKNVLVLCTGNSCRSILAQALINHLGRGKFKAFSAGSNPTREVHPKSIETLNRYKINTEGLYSKSWDEYKNLQFDLIITVCDTASKEDCLFFSGKSQKTHWDIPDPASVKGDNSLVNSVFDRTYNMLKNKIKNELL